jgi:predicted regulator of Ras-like GTPase activity (Roadblock/LC7/MglB family)
MNTSFPRLFDLLENVKDLLEKVKARFRPPRSSTPPPLPAPVDKPESDKLSKTVLPNAVRTITPDATSSPPPAGNRSHMVAMGPTVKRPLDLPPAVARALEPRVERALSLTLADVLDRVPEGYLKPRDSFDATQRVLLKATEVEKGMAVGRPTLSLATLYQQVPEIFMHNVPASDATTVELPFRKVVEELSNLRVRHDQTEEQITAQYQTPFLQVTVEESERFGIKMEPVQVTEFPRVRIGVEPATAEAIAAAEPEATAREKFTPSNFGTAVPEPRPTKRSAPPVEPPVPPALSEPKSAEPAAREEPPECIPFSLNPATPKRQVSVERAPEKSLPNGTGEPAFPRVPASSGPPVPPSAPDQPIRIPFKLSAALEAKAEQTPSVPETTGKVEDVAVAKSIPSVSSDEPVITLPLRPILESLPPIQIAGDVSSVPAETKVSFRFALIAPQLASGKIVVQPKDFQAALPVDYRNLFLADAIEAPVQLSLPDVLTNLPGDALRMREDQEVITQDEVFETPFSTKAAEDAQRFATGTKSDTEPASDAGLAAKSESGSASETEQAPDAELASKGGLASQLSLASKAEPMEAAPEQAALVGGIAPKPAEEPQVKGEWAEVVPAAPLEREIGEKPTEKSPVKSETAERAKVVWPKTESARLAILAPAKAQPTAPVPKFEAKDAVAKALALPGITSCGIIFADGLTIAGNIPAEMHVDGLSAMAPTLLQKVEKHMLETQLGALTCLTVYGEEAPVTFFAFGNVCLTAMHGAAELTAETRRELATITKELSRTYAQPGTAHVDH